MGAMATSSASFPSIHLSTRYPSELKAWQLYWFVRSSSCVRSWSWSGSSNRGMTAPTAASSLSREPLWRSTSSEIDWRGEGGRGRERGRGRGRREGRRGGKGGGGKGGENEIKSIIVPYIRIHVCKHVCIADLCLSECLLPLPLVLQGGWWCEALQTSPRLLQPRSEFGKHVLHRTHLPVQCLQL